MNLTHCNLSSRGNPAACSAARLALVLLIAAIIVLTTASCSGDADEPVEAPAVDPTSEAQAAPSAVDPTAEALAGPTALPLDTSEDEGQSGASGPDGSLPGDVEVPGYDVVAVVQEWSEFGSDGELEEAIGRNLGAGGDNAMALSLVPGEVQRLAIDYEIDELDPHDFVGFNRDLGAEQDWSGATHVAVQIEPVTGAPEDFVFQWREQESREVWRYAGPLGEVPESGLLLIPLEEGPFERALWSGLDNGQIDPGSVDQYGLYVGHVGPGISGEMTMGPIMVVRESD